MIAVTRAYAEFRAKEGKLKTIGLRNDIGLDPSSDQALETLSVLFFPEFYKSLPSWTRQFTGSEITVAVLVCTALNALFLLGTWRYGQFRLGADGTPLTAASFNSFFDQQASEWKIPVADVQRVREVVDQATEHVAAKTQGPCVFRSEAIASTLG